MVAGTLATPTPAAPLASPARLWARAVAAIRAHPDLVVVAALVVVGLIARGMLLARAPLFLRRDSVAYFQVGWEFANGMGFDLPLRRTPLYPLFVAGSVWLLGEDLRGLALAQHLLGVVTIVATYGLGRAMFGRWAGALAALGVSVSATLLIYEHYILAEPLFIPLLTLGMLLLVLALQQGGLRLFLLAGIVLALAALSRPIGQALLPLGPIIILVHHWRGGLRGLVPAIRLAIAPAAFVLIGFALVLAPWSVRNSMTTGRVDGAGALGQSLIGRIVRHDEGFILPKPDSPAPYADARKAEIRGLILTQMNRDARPSAINHRIRNVFGLTEPQADAAMREVAIEIFTSQPGRYVEGTLAKFRRLMIGEDERFRTHWATRKDGELRDAWTSEESIAHLYSPPSPIQEREFSVAEAVTRVFQPYLWAWLLGPLVLLGIGWGLWRGPRAATVLLVLTVLALVFPSAALVGYVPRYRYPVDPLLLVLAAGGLAALVSLARTGLARVSRRPA
ncbi:MAG: glycosyltransferase family 39 protein [Chloroflexi bacterium]|nr:glycosyltransferase family 39 protein [Chloroflexota bacterium]